MMDKISIIYILVIMVIGLGVSLIYYDSKNGHLSTENVRLQKLYQTALQNSITDELTGLYNRRHIFDRLKEEIARAIRYSHNIQILYVDLDNFKAVNDKMGHDFGDKILRQAADVIRSCLRQYDLIARTGIGDEFAAVLPETSHGLCLRAAKAILKEIGEISINGGEIKISASIGVHQFDGKRAEEWLEKDTDKLAEEAISAADTAMYNAKNSGKSRIFISALN